MFLNMRLCCPTFSLPLYTQVCTLTCIHTKKPITNKKMLHEYGDAKPLGFVINLRRIEEIIKRFWLCFGEKGFLVDMYVLGPLAY